MGWFSRSKPTVSVTPVSQPLPQVAAPTVTPKDTSMSFITALESDISKVEKVLESWWGKEPAFYNVLSVGVNIVGISLETVFTIDGNGPAATLVGNIVSKAQQELLAVNTLVKTVGPTPTGKSLLAGVASDVSQLEAAANITDPKSVAALTLAVNTLNNLVASFPVTAPTPAPAA